MAEPLIDARGVHTHIGASRILRGVDFRVERGESVALMGRNGMGKTTLLRTVLGILRPAQGSLRVRGDDVTREPTYRIARRGIAYVPEGRGIFPGLSVREVAAAARAAGLATHMDGARLMNAVVASGVPARAFADGIDSVWIDFSKGLGCPVGAMLAGSREFIGEAWRLKQRWGGAMRQAGILGAAALHALDHHVERLADDHANARLLAVSLAELPGIRVDPAAIETNIVFFDVGGTGRGAGALCEALTARGVQMGAFGDTLIRAVTHLDVTREHVMRAVDAMREVLAETSR